MNAPLMIESMTGYGEARAAISGKTFICRIKSLNHRFLDLKIRLPRGDFMPAEIAIRKRLNEIFKRGSIELSVQIESSGEGPENLVNERLALLYVKSVDELATRLQGTFKTTPLSIDALIRLPGVINAQGEDVGGLAIDDQALLQSLVEPALLQLKQSRLTEGAVLAEHLKGLLDELALRLSQIKALENPEKERARQLMENRARETLKVLGGGATTQTDFKARLQEEAVFWIERRDFEEERVRLEAHLNSCRELLSKPIGETSGRRLEFLHQEMLRETNTMGTKAQSPAITSHTIEMKAILERWKEQVANVS